NVYVADYNNHTIRKISPDATVSTLAGLAEVPGSADGDVTSARFNLPYGLAVDEASNIYVADSGNQTIRKITPGGVVLTVAGVPGGAGSDDGLGDAARFYGPTGLTIDRGGNLYVADSGSSTIRKITPSGFVSTLAGSSGAFISADGAGSTARFNWPFAVATDASGSVFIADTLNHTIRKLTPNGLVSTVAGSAGIQGHADGLGSSATFTEPESLGLDTPGNIYVADTDNHTIRKITPAGEVTTLAGRALTPGADDGTNSTATFRWPSGVAVTAGGAVFVADSGNSTIRLISPTGVVTTLAGLAGQPGNADGPASEARFNFPWGIALDPSGNLYISDYYSHTIRKLAPDGMVTTVAGLAGNPGSQDGKASSARFYSPAGVAV
ncbi:MAG: NHL repeat-containing protein, partial [Limisphaerales bacterium]